MPKRIRTAPSQAYEAGTFTNYAIAPKNLVGVEGIEPT